MEDKVWIKWDVMAPPEDIKGYFIKFDDGKIWTDAHYFGSKDFKAKSCGKANPVEWTFMERQRLEKSIKCSDSELK